MHPKVLSRVVDGGQHHHRQTAGDDKDTNHYASTTVRHRVHLPAVLQDHARYRVRDVDYPAVVPELGKAVRGVLVEGLSDAAIARLDSFEGDEYERRSVVVQTVPPVAGSSSSSTTTSESRSVECQTYIWLDPTQLLAEEWDFEAFERDCIHRWSGERGEQEYEMLHDTLVAAGGGGGQVMTGKGVDDGTRGRSAFL